MPIGHKTIGTGPQHVLVMHDWSGGQTNYDPVLPYLDTETFTYAFVDLRGYGTSRHIAGDYSAGEAASDCLAVADTLGWSDFHLVGHSMTGMVAQRMMVDAPGRITSAVVICAVSAAGYPMDDETWQFFVSTTEQEDAYLDLQRGVCSDMLCEGWLNAKLRWNRDAASSEIRQAYLTMFSKTNFVDEISGDSTPILVIVGEKDTEGLNAKAMESTFLAMHPNAELLEIPNCGHYPMQECPPFFTTALEAFLRRQAA